MAVMTNFLLLAGVAACSAIAMPASAQSKAAEVPTFPQGTEVVRLPYAKPVDFDHLASLHVRMSINGGPPQSFDVDTGSVGIVVGAVSIPNFDGSGPHGELTYSSSGVEEKGVWTTVEITFPDARMPDGRPVRVHVPVLAVTSMNCSGKGVNGDHCRVSTSAPNPHMLGVGFGRRQSATFDGEMKNAFLQLDDMVAGKMRRGYMISPAGIQLGLNAETIGPGWVWQKLNARTAIPENYSGPKDWETPPGTFAVNGKAMPMGSVLMDTGLTNMMLESGSAPHDGDVPTGTPVTIFLIGGQLKYDFAVNDDANPLTPRKTSFRNPAHGTFVNTGLHALALFDYCFDDDGGYLGLRPRRKPGS